ncbi:MAG: HAD-IB family phosphatase, partial [Patescibacteria group bacterium]
RKTTMGVSCIIPAFNEEKRVGRVIAVARRVCEISEILVIDDGSSDETVAAARKHGARVIRHEINIGKGAALRTGARHAKHDHLVFLDADLGNITPTKIKKLIAPLIAGEADFVKAAYDISSGRVTQLVVRPLLKIVYPNIKLNYPLSGEFALHRRKFRFGKIEEGWGVDIQLVLQAARKKLVIKEVSLGKKEHKHQNIENLAKMSKEVIRTILSETKLISHRHKLIVFDLDKTLIAGSSIEFFAKEWKFTRELATLRRKVKRGEMLDREITRKLACHFRGRTQREVSIICEKIPICPHAARVIEVLRQQRYKVRIISAAFSPVVKYFAGKLKIHDFICPVLARDKSKRFTGKLKVSSYDDSDGKCCGMWVCKKKAVQRLLRKLGVKKDETVAVGDGKSDRCLFEASGLSLGYRTKKLGDEQIENLSEVLVFAD